MSRKTLFYGSALLLLIGLFAFRGSSHQTNSLLRWGFPLSDSSVVIYEAPQNLRGEELFIKANLTPAQAKNLLKAFTLQPLKEASLGPKELQPKLENPQWLPGAIQKSWQGGFVKREGSNIFHCTYIFDIKNANRFVLYFYAVAFDDEPLPAV